MEEKCSNLNHPTTENTEQLEILKLEHDNIYEELSREQLFARRQLGMKRETKVTKYVLNLESRRKAKSSVRKVFNKEKFLVTDPQKRSFGG